MRKREDLTGFGARLRQIREERNISQNDMIKMVNLYFGFNRLKTVQAFNRYEIYNAQPDVDLLICFARVLGTTVDYLVGNEVTPEQSILQECISLVQKTIGKDTRTVLSCVDKGNGIIEFVSDELDEKFKAVFNYEDFINVVNEADKRAQDEYLFEFIHSFYQELLTYGYANKDKVEYIPKNNNADEYSKEWLAFNESKERSKINKETINKFFSSLNESEYQDLTKALIAGTEKEHPLYKKLMAILDENEKKDGDK